MESVWIDDNGVLSLLDDLQKTGRVSNIVIMDEMGREWNQKEFKVLQAKMEEEPTNAVIFLMVGMIWIHDKPG